MLLLALLIAATPFDYDKNAPLDVQQKEAQISDGIAKSAVSFASPKGGRATGFLFVPEKRAGKLPAILLMHGAPGNAAQVENRALFMAKHGAIVLTLDAPFARKEGEMSFDAATIRADAIQLAIDQMRAFDLLAARPDVDPQRLAYVGGSFGGAAGTTLAGLDHRPKAYVLFVADGGWVEHFHVDGKWLGPANEEWAKSLEDVMGLAWVSKATPGAIYFQSGTQDEFVPPSLAKRVQALAPQPKIQWYESGHKLPASAQADQLAWLHEKIGTDAPRRGDENGAPPLQQRK